MHNLHRTGLLKRQRDRRAYRYRPALTAEEYIARLVCEALDGSSRLEFVLAHLIEQIGPEKSARLSEAFHRLHRP
ncbi:BlaI/MecI/CopY family transcriptional regulator [Nocardia terpenica]|uniref:BlaI/MecI/CopY family transcriptional regulator n=1 Tax=Nocardia terpenica TaxID=455432 RepID=UPI001EECA127|nr:BlaI/MecI/CopY family transcriptional regulator [Nocardia terpenica]